jgi:predicted RNase H-like HicB family nuclease
LATSPDVPGLVAEGRTITEVVQIAQDLTRRIVESCLEHGDPVPPTLTLPAHEKVIELRVPVSIR